MLEVGLKQEHKCPDQSGEIMISTQRVDVYIHKVLGDIQYELPHARWIMMGAVRAG